MENDPLTIEEYCESNGFRLSDFTHEELESIAREVEALNKGEDIGSGFFCMANYIIYARKGLHEEFAG